MQLQELGQMPAHLAQSLVRADPIWERQADEVQPIDLTMFHARMAAQGLALEAREALEQLQAEALRVVVLQGLDGLPLLGFRFDKVRNRFAVDELLDGLKRMDREHVQATLFALETRLLPKQVVDLTWSQVLRMSAPAITPLANEIVRERNKLRHVRLPYVFWGWLQPGIGAPLVNLAEIVERAFSMPWDQLMALYEDVLLIDRRAELDSFRQALGG